MQLPSPPMVPAPPFVPKWPTAGVVPQPSPRPFVIQGQARPFAAQLQLQAVVPPHLSPNTFIPLGSVFHSGVSAPGDDVCVNMQTDEKKPNCVHRVPWTHCRGLAAREACQALAKDPSKKAFRLRARRCPNCTRYLPVIAPPQLGVAHARVLKIADRRRSRKSGSTVRTVFGP
ncbi:hypothetical protein FOMPIDRAFT_83105 [Fomitopsis schrenkii]|uniref:Uncharacterized protein n=1 Tax=Fomitopsis schrenkii TaxID=2126942 RepID=S8F3S0_FOMSC|nr:hypothetical protein FOMPIDRAFT_83105 [Fomitopsis schrenkii]